MQKDYSILIGGKAGDGIKHAGNTTAKLFNRLGYWIFAYVDYPSLIKGGHNFVILRANSQKILAHKNKIDVLVAFNKDTIEKHSWRLKKGAFLIFDSNSINLKSNKLGLPLGEIVKNLGLPQIARNTAALGALAALFGIKFSIVENVIKSSINIKVKENIQAAKQAYKLIKKPLLKVSPIKNTPKPLLTGNEAIALGAVKAGLKAYIAYPMTPASSILHYLAKYKKELNITTVHPENEIAVIGMAQGASYAGIKNMIGTSGGGFALMIEHLSLSGQAEIPLVIVLSQRPGPATGVPTYTAQADLFFSLYAGHGEFPRIVLAPGDTEEAFYSTAESLNLAWKFQIPVILLSDKHLSESIFSSELNESKITSEKPKLWNKKGNYKNLELRSRTLKLQSNYKRYTLTKDGVSPLAFPGEKNAVIKSNGYEHDEYGITTEDAPMIIKGNEKRLKKMETIENELKKKETVKVYGNKKSKTVLIAWGSTKGIAIEVAKIFNIKVVQPLYLMPFPKLELKKHLKNAEKIIDIEINTTGQLGDLLKFHGFKIDKKILKYDGRPFAVDELEKIIKKLL